MFRTVLSVVVAAALLAGAPCLAAQTSAPQASPKSSPRSSGKPALATPININTASATELDSLPGIGAKTAARIVEYRQKNGPFKKVEELMNVRGVGEKNFLKLKEHITVTPVKADHANQQQ
ncbi:MAG TPA: helix-hairpin-helix domain-containing protein [Vicinamibacterales bacterium]|jgi:competence protein ComEA